MRLSHYIVLLNSDPVKNIEILENERLIENAANVGGYFKERLGELFEKHPMIGDVRGIGLMLSAPGGLFEVSLSLWLIFKGFNTTNSRAV